MHLAETPEETRYLTHGDGPFAGFLDALGKGAPFEEPPGMRPVAWADRTGLLDANCLVIHGNDLDDGDVATLARHHATVVYCHGTHRYFERPAHRLAELVAVGVNVAFGTDSELSNEGVDSFAELQRLAADRKDVDPLLLLRCATYGGRVALGLEPEASRFAVGTRADGLLLSNVPDEFDASTDPRIVAEWALSGSARIAATILGGRPVADTADMPSALRAFLDTTDGQG